MSAQQEISPLQVVAMVKKHARPWKGTATFSPPLCVDLIDVTQVGMDVFGSVPLRYKSMEHPTATSEVVRRVQRLAAMPEFYRLNFIRQLANTHHAVNLEGAHNRLSHSLGTLDVAACFIDRFIDKVPETAFNSPILETRHLTDEEIKATLVYAFAHDCFHGPMGHTLDSIRDILWGARAGDRTDKYLLKKHIALRSGFLWDGVQKYVASSPAECRRIFELLTAFVGSAGTSLGDKAFLAEIVDSDLDSDRIDYIWRDHSHLEMTNLEKRDDIRPLINSALPIKVVTHGPTYVSMGDVVETNTKSETHLYFSIGHSEIVRVLMEKRVEFYRRYYEHPLKLVADEMLIHVIFYALRHARILQEEAGAIDEFGDEFSFLTDDGLIAFLTELTSNPGYEIPCLLFRDFLTNRNFEIAYTHSLPRQKLTELRLRDIHTRTELDRLVRDRWPEIERAAASTPIGLIDNAEYVALIRDFDKIIATDIFVDDNDAIVDSHKATVGHRQLKYSRDNDIFRLSRLYGSGFTKRAKLEMLLWSDLQRNLEFSNALVSLSDQIATSTGAKTDEIYLQMRKTPLVFIAPSWIPTMETTGLSTHSRAPRRGSEVRFHQNGSPVPMPYNLHIGEEESDYPLIVSAPKLLCDLGMRELIKKSFLNLLDKRMWLFPDML